MTSPRPSTLPPLGRARWYDYVRVAWGWLTLGFSAPGLWEDAVHRPHLAVALARIGVAVPLVAELLPPGDRPKDPHVHHLGRWLYHAWERGVQLLNAGEVRPTPEATTAYLQSIPRTPTGDRLRRNFLDACVQSDAWAHASLAVASGAYLDGYGGYASTYPTHLMEQLLCHSLRSWDVHHGLPDYRALLQQLVALGMDLNTSTLAVDSSHRLELSHPAQVPAMVAAGLDLTQPAVAGRWLHSCLGHFDSEQFGEDFYRQRKLDLLEALLDAGASPNARSAWGYTPLQQVVMCSAHGGFGDASDMNFLDQLAQRLLAAGADPTERTPQGDSIMHLALANPEHNRPSALMKRLVEANARSLEQPYSAAVPEADPYGQLTVYASEATERPTPRSIVREALAQANKKLASHMQPSWYHITVGYWEDLHAWVEAHCMQQTLQQVLVESDEDHAVPTPRARRARL